MKAPVEVQFAQKLAANEPGLRNKAVKKLKKWFSARQEPFSDLDMMKLWKGLYYCFWMSDKPLVQEELAENIGSFVSCFKSQQSSLLFIKSFPLTLGREWAGIDRWRTEKFMMFTRRFLRHIFKFLAASHWDRGLVQETVKVFSENVILSRPPKTNVDFQLHFTDVFLEELAKVAGQTLNTDLLQIILGPFIEVLRKCSEARFRDHVVERIFKHLLRQSDPGINWQNEEFDQDGEDENEAEEEEEDAENGSDEDEENPAESDEDEEMVAPEDPRAGGVHAVIPQLTVDYQSLSEKMFEVGSEDGLKNNNRQALYELSKMFKDVANDVFPLGPNIEDDEMIPKIKVSKETKKLMQATEEARKKQQQEKIDFRKALKVQTVPELAENGEKDEEEEGNGLNGDVDSNDEEDINEEEEADDTPSQKSEASKELKKKRKREQKKRKKERLLKEASEKELKENKSKELVDQDIQRVNLVEIKKKEKKAIVKSNLEEKERKYQEKQAKVEEVKEKKEKKKKSKEKSEESSMTPQPQVNGVDSSTKKKKKKKAKESVADVEMTPVESVAAEEKTSKKEAILAPTEATLESFEKIKKKKKDKKKAKENKPLYRIDSDIAFNAPSLSQINLMKLDDEKKPVEMKEPEPIAVEQTSTPVPVEKAVKKKKLKKYNAESSLLIDESETPILTIKPSALPFVTEHDKAEDSPSKPKKKKKAQGESGASPKSSKVFEEDNCWGELQPGETEIVLPNKKYKGQTKLAKEAEAPMVTPAKTFTATFLKKAMSKSEKKAEKKKMKADSQTLSEPRKKKVNVVLTKNVSQDFVQHLKSVKNSPQTPHDPNKNPPKSALKRTPNGAGMSSVSKTLNPVQLNTQLNGRTSIGTAEKLAGKNRKRAADFF